MRTFFKLIFYLFMAVIGLFAFAAYMGAPDQPPTRAPLLSAQEVRSRAATISYESLARTPTTYTGQLVTFRGKVIQASQRGQDYVLRVSVNKDKYDIWSDTLFVNYRTASQNDPRILEGDIIQLWGEFVGIKSYTAILGNTVQIPQVVARVIEGSR